MARVLFVVAKNDFRDEEYFVPREILEKAGHQIKVASNGRAGEVAVGAGGGEAEIDLLLSQVASDDFDAVIFVGGPGALKHLDNEQSYRLAQEAAAKNKLLAAICIAPVILAKAGVLQGKKATVWSSPLERSPIKILTGAGAAYLEEDVVQDGKLITANGPQAAAEFGQALSAYLAPLINHR